MYLILVLQYLLFDHSSTYEPLVFESVDMRPKLKVDAFVVCYHCRTANWRASFHQRISASDMWWSIRTVRTFDPELVTIEDRGVLLLTNLLVGRTQAWLRIRSPVDHCPFWRQCLLFRGKILIHSALRYRHPFVIIGLIFKKQRPVDTSSEL